MKTGELPVSFYLCGPEPRSPEKLQQPVHDDAGGSRLQSLLCRGSPQMLQSRNAGDHHRPHRQSRGTAHDMANAFDRVLSWNHA